MALIASGCAIHDLSLAIDDTDRGLFHGDIEADVVLLAHGGAPTLDRGTIMPRLPPRDHRRGMTIYLWSGKRVAYLKKSNTGYDVYGFNGDHLGWSLPLAPSMIATR